MSDEDFVTLTRTASDVLKNNGLSGDLMLPRDEVLRLCDIAARGIYAVHADRLAMELTAALTRAGSIQKNEHSPEYLLREDVMRLVTTWRVKWDKLQKDRRTASIPASPTPAGYVRADEFSCSTEVTESTAPVAVKRGTPEIGRQPLCAVCTPHGECCSAIVPCSHLRGCVDRTGTPPAWLDEGRRLMHAARSAQGPAVEHYRSAFETWVWQHTVELLQLDGVNQSGTPPANA